MKICKVPPLVQYSIKLQDVSGGTEISGIKLAGKSVRTFQRPVTQHGSKIYAVKSPSGDIVYFGQTVRSIGERLHDGLKATGKHGYHGYEWARKLDRVDLFIWCFQKEDRKQIEAIEAEVVYLVRHSTGQWPKYQTEIHFHRTNEQTRQIAKMIYDILCNAAG